MICGDPSGSVIHWANGVDNVAAGEGVPRGNFSRAGITAVEGLAFVVEGTSGSGVNGTVLGAGY
jgi:hypothetical protein